jgi:Protein of unknown function (DUF1688)
MSTAKSTARAPAQRNDDGAAPELLGLRSAAAVRQRSDLVYGFVAGGHSPHFTIDSGRLDAIADAVATLTRENYPDLRIPVHSRWRHFAAGGTDRWAGLAQRLAGTTPRVKARTAIDLAVISVLLDAGAGDAWRYREAGSGRVFARSEGLAVASFDMFAAGDFSSDPASPLQADAEGLLRLDAARLASGLQVSPDNPLVGLGARVDLLNRLGGALAPRKDLFGAAPARPGCLIDHFLHIAQSGRVAAGDILAALLDGMAPIWPSGLVVDGVPLGDVGRHRAIVTRDRSDGLVPFHKLSQWLTYSLIEPVEAAGLSVVELDALTGLAEYRNGGLFIDLGAIVPRMPLDPDTAHAVASELVVEWRALTVALMDRLLDPVREKLGVTAADFPLAKMLQGGTWAAGRKVAASLRPPAGPPPLLVAADGTVF